MRLSVIVPVYNEEKTVLTMLTKLSEVDLDMEVVVVDDASTDRTWEILQEMRQQAPFNTYRYVRHEHNQGKGVGLRTGFALVTGDMVTIQDADMEYDPQDLPALVRKWEEGKTQGLNHIAVYGYRNLAEQKFTTRWGNRFLTTMTNILFGSRIHDMETCYKMLPCEVAKALPMEGRRFEIEPEITSCLLQAGYTILEVPISYYPRQDKKLAPWKDGWPALAMLLRRRFGQPFQVPVVAAREETVAAK
ncbi:glycosyltransferase family 2 protein [Ktedonobacter racemifer]|uniref:Glycosyl transferase family 2 n=1 Tax=Ktedonobacter racemifer DSM 44963 TaxID=485913 RepID=D6TEJ2_KTERA|nr:glycosyltransferase family 2 protein [Ktedonobacter racemifer]EFH90365.1 glycosyl transferase family 2 [Ktedonobacter racemifer DSM 44963]